MNDQIWMQELDQMCRRDLQYQIWLKKAKELEPAYEQLRRSLAEEQREILDQYLMVCEEMDHTRQTLAYHLGSRHSR